jgi:hypothetical protein
MQQNYRQWVSREERDRIRKTLSQIGETLSDNNEEPSSSSSSSRFLLKTADTDR